jgi:hypothetical protein
MLKAYHVVGYVIAGVVGGFVIAAVAGGFVPAGVASLAQGCAQGEQDQLTLLGEGGCRTANGAQGAHTTIAAVSLDQCKEKCLDLDGMCTALEYNSDNNNCEIHSESITSFAQSAGVSCYKR